jgi:hypothetical protein
MISRKPADERLADWTPDLKVPKHTLWLPVASDRPLKELGSEAALNVLGLGTPEDRLEKFAGVIRDGTKAARDRGARMGGLIFFPDCNRLPPIAEVEVFGYHSKDPDKPSSLEFYRDLYGTPTERSVGPIEVNDLQLPAGPAIRFHSKYWPKQSWDPIAHLWEDVTYAVRPPRIQDTVVLKVSWVEFKFSEDLIKSADAIAQTLEIKLRDA